MLSQQEGHDGQSTEFQGMFSPTNMQESFDAQRQPLSQQLNLDITPVTTVEPQLQTVEESPESNQ